MVDKCMYMDWTLLLMIISFFFGLLWKQMH
nr:MAG TPA_asm: protein of unknown function (DUF4094) [Inoviridae sp.]